MLCHIQKSKKLEFPRNFSSGVADTIRVEMLKGIAIYRDKQNLEMTNLNPVSYTHLTLPTNREV